MWVRIDKKRFFRRVFLMELKRSYLTNYRQECTQDDAGDLADVVSEIKKRANENAEVYWNLMVTPYILLDEEQP